MGKIYVVGIGPGCEEMMTLHAKNTIEACDVIVGYRTYIELIRKLYPGKEFIESGMRSEIDRCRTCLELAKEGRTVALICSGDAGVYAMASPMMETALDDGFSDVETVPGVTAAQSGSALLGAVIANDYCTISLSDLLTPWDVIEKRLRCAAEGDYCIAIYNPSSHNRAGYLKRACSILLEILPGDRPCGYVRNIGRDDTSVKVCTLSELCEEQTDMFTTVFVGNSATYIKCGRLITPRGYDIK